MEGPNTQAESQQTSDKLSPEGIEVPSQLNWSVMEPRIRQMLGDWSPEIRETKLRRAQRKLDVDVESLRQGTAQNPAQLNADETLIPVRVIDENIRKEHPLYVNYLTQSRRLAIFDNSQVPQEKREQLEIAFTKGMMYSGFLKNIFKFQDGASLHGWDWVEVLFNKNKPLNCAVEHIGHENLIFSRDSKDHQGQEFILRALDLTVTKLQEFQKKYGFSSAVVQSIIEDAKSRNHDLPKNIRVYKYFTKVDEIVYVGWCTLRSEDGGSSVIDWLKKPELLDLGRRELVTITELVTENVTSMDMESGLPVSIPVQRPVQKQIWQQTPENFYPIVINIYAESEEQCITDQKGRAFFDNPSQEAQIAMWSFFINGSVRASNVYASVKGPNSTGGPPNRTDTSLEHGCIYDTEMNFFHTDYPDPTILRAADSLNNRKAQEMGQTASAVINRDDSRKTAEELKQARGEQMQMSTVQIMLFSQAMREILTICWYIVQSQAEQGNIILLPTTVQIPGPIPRQETINDLSVISQKFDIKPAGDTDVLRREEKLQRRMMILPLIQPTSAYPQFLMDLISETLPEDAEKYNSILRQGMASMKQQMMAMATMLREAVTDETGKIKPEFQEFSGQLQQMFAMIPQQTQQAGATEQNEQSNRNGKEAA